ncbi:hypothetical protein [Roseicella frigidaeris]|uniref:Uncharacterized protein n=1 Tax=Roseicella frigidaeris TaxID=2230885 RepID=A0A327ME17_9PROT|nr:hypothetical protein [Roseicella frigidaeris]RAI60889.1 hypothetical protein DOO78_01805 [Roseicella frigidaeris]
MRLLTLLAAAGTALMLAGAAIAATQARPDAPRMLGALSQFFECGDPAEAALLARDILDEAEFAATLDPSLLARMRIE